MPEQTQVEHPRMINNAPPPASPPSGGGGLLGHFKKHQAVWLIGLGGATLFVMFMMWRNQQNQNAATMAGYPVAVPNTNTPDNALGQGNYDPSMAPDWYTNLTNTVNQNTSALTNLASLIGQGQPSTTPVTTTTGHTTPTPTSTPPPTQSPFAGLGANVNYQLPANTRIYAGSQGRWWFQKPGGTQQLLTGPHGSDLQPWLPDNQFQKIVAGAQGRYWWEQGGVGALKPLVPTAQAH